MSPLRGGGGARTKHYRREILKSPLYEEKMASKAKMTFLTTKLTFPTTKIRLIWIEWGFQKC